MVTSIQNVGIVPAQPLQRQSSAAEDPQNARVEEDLNGEKLALEQLEEAVASQEEAPSVLSNELTEEEQRIVEELKQTDREVRAHEQAHKSAAGPYAGAISYETVTGPDGRQYAVGGEVPIDTSPIPNNPQATIQKMDIVIRAALAPADPSPQDFAVARTAQQVRAQAQKELQDLREAEREEARDSNPQNPADIEEFDPNTPNPAQQLQIQALIEGLNDSQNLTENRRGILIDAIN